MRILLINVPHPAIGSRIPDDHLPPLGLLTIGGPLIDDGHEVTLVDGEFGPMSIAELVAAAAARQPDAVLFGHSGSTSGHPGLAAVARAVSLALPRAAIVYGGVFPTYHWREILTAEPYARRRAAAWTIPSSATRPRRSSRSALARRQVPGGKPTGPDGIAFFRD